jgi:hypothetical protein
MIEGEEEERKTVCVKELSALISKLVKLAREGGECKPVVDEAWDMFKRIKPNRTVWLKVTEIVEQEEEDGREYAEELLFEMEETLPNPLQAWRNLVGSFNLCGQFGPDVSIFEDYYTFTEELVDLEHFTERIDGVDHHFCKVPHSDFLLASNMRDQSSEVVYLRDSVKKQMDFMTEFVKKEPDEIDKMLRRTQFTGYIGGPAGSGKSLVSFYWASKFTSMDDSKSIIFIKFLGECDEGFIRFRFGIFHQGTFRYTKKSFVARSPLHFFKSYLYPIMRYWHKDSANSIVICDGLTSETGLDKLPEFLKVECGENSHQIQILSCCLSGLHAITDPWEYFQTDPWLLEEYYVASRNDQLIALEAKKENQDVKRLVFRKFYYAGFCAQWMFKQTLAYLPQIVARTHLREVEKFVGVKSNITNQETVDRQLANFVDNGVVCHYGLRLFASRNPNISSPLAMFLRNHAANSNSKETLGIAFELHVKGLIESSVGVSGGGISLINQEGESVSWNVTQPALYFENLSDLRIPDDFCDAWLFPLSFQEGYVMFRLIGTEDGYFVRFIQTSVENTARFHEQCYLDTLNMLRFKLNKFNEHGEMLLGVEIAVLIPQSRLEQFVFSQVLRMKLDYPQSTGIQQKASIYFIKDDDSWNNI